MAILSSINWADDPGVTFSVIAGTEMLPLEQLQRRWGEGLARGDLGGIAVFWFEVDLGVERPIVTLGLKGMNGNCEVRYALYNGAGGTSEVMDYTIVEYLDDWAFPFGAACWLHCPGVAWSARYVRIRVDITASGATWVDMRRLWIGGGTIISGGVDRAFEIDFVDLSPSERTPRGGVSADEEAIWRKVRFSATNRTEAILFDAGGAGLWQQLVRAGRSREIVVAIRTNAATDFACYVDTVHAQLIEWAPLIHSAGNRRGIRSMLFEEVPLVALS